MPVGYMITLQDNMSDSYSVGIPEADSLPQVVFTSFEEAKATLNQFTKTFRSFIPVAYGKAYPYDSTTFEKVLETGSFAPYGWAVREHEGEAFRVSVGLLKVQVR